VITEKISNVFYAKIIIPFKVTLDLKLSSFNYCDGNVAITMLNQREMD
jgi:hypothetical protein